jgi:hypothetical protein
LAIAQVVNEMRVTATIDCRENSRPRLQNEPPHADYPQILVLARSHKSAEKIGLRVGKVINRYQVAKHFYLKITDNHFSYQRNSQKMEMEANLDGICDRP